MKTTMKKIAAYLLALLLVLQVLPVMAEEQTVSGQQGPITSYRDKLKIDAVTSTITVGMSITLTTTENYDDLTWKSENEDIATVDENGVVTGVSAGKVKITATEDGHSDSITIRVVGTSSGEEGSGSAEKMVIIINGQKEKVTYDGQEHSLTYKATSDNGNFKEEKLHLISNDHLAAGKDCGVYQDTLTEADFSYDGDEEVEYVITNGWLQIKPATVTIYADSKTKREGAEDPAFTATVEGLVAGDDPVQIVYSFETKTENGTTKIIPVADSIQGNYKVNTVSAELIILPRKTLYNLAKIDGAFYRLKKTEIWTEKDPVRDTNQNLNAEDYSVDDYDFTDLTITINGKDYIYNCKQNTEAIVLGANYYTVKLISVSIVKNKIGGMNGNTPRWAIPEEDRYDDPNNTDSLHRDFEIKLIENTMVTEPQRAYNMLSVNGSGDYYKLPSSAVIAQPLSKYSNGNTVKEGEYVLEQYDFTNLVLTLDGVEYKYNDGSLDEYENYYTVEFEALKREAKFNKNDKWFNNPDSWLDGAYEEYGSMVNATPTFHVNYKAKTHKAVPRPERSVSVTSDFTGAVGYIGLKITLTSHLTGFEEGKYTLQWQYSTDGVNWTDEVGATGDTFTYELNETTTHYSWRVVAYDVK